VYSNPDTQDRRIDLYMADWRESMPRRIHGSLVVRDILTHGDYFSPPQKGAVLPADNFVAHGSLAAHASTPVSRLDGQQEVFYITGGTGTLTGGGELAKLRKDVVILMPANLDFVMTNTGDQLLTMYVINEPTPAGFKPNPKMLMLDERVAHVRTPVKDDPYIVPGASGHWAHVVREIFAPRDGLATLSNVLTVELPPLSLGEPHPHRIGTEEVWLALEGNSLAWMASELRTQRPGMAYMIRPDGASTHSNINFGDTTVKFLYFSGHVRLAPTPAVR
jgi:mannose-6-phosphate isomerase-like protein (cupin superfamily)